MDSKTREKVRAFHTRDSIHLALLCLYDSVTRGNPTGLSYNSTLTVIKLLSTIHEHPNNLKIVPYARFKGRIICAESNVNQSENNRFSLLALKSVHVDTSDV